MNYRIEVVYNILRLWIVNKTYPPKLNQERLIIKSEEIKKHPYPYGQK